MRISFSYAENLIHYPLISYFLSQGALFGLSAPCEIDVKLNKIENRKNGTIKDKNGNTFKAPVFMVSKVKVVNFGKSVRYLFYVGWRRHQRSSQHHA